MATWREIKKTVPPKTAGVYLITNTASNKVYVGISTNISNRVYGHFYKLRKNKHQNRHLQYSFNKHGIDMFDISVLETFHGTYTDKDLLIAEHKYQVQYNALERGYGYNIRPTDIDGTLRHSDETKKLIGTKSKGRIVSQETRYKLSVAGKGRHSYTQTEEQKAHLSKMMTGKKHTQATKDKMSADRLGKTVPPRTDQWRERQRAANLGKKHTQATKDKISIAGKGRKHTKESIAKMSASQKGHTVSQEARDKSSATQKGRKMTAKQRASMWDRSGGNNPTAVTITVIETGMIFTTIKDAALYFNCNRHSLEKMIKNNILRRSK